MSFGGIYWPVLISMILAISLALVLWFIKKKEKLRSWFPILKIFPYKKYSFFSIFIDLPPLFLVISFLLMSGVLIFLTLGPYETKYTSIVKNGTVHLVADFSPSVQAHIGIEDYRSTLKDMIHKLHDNGQSVIFYTSYQDKYNVEDIKAIDSLIDKIEFHSAGIKISHLIKNLKIDSGILIIVSDSDFHSWNNFDLSSFSRNILVKKVNVDKQTQVSNIYFDDVTVLDRIEDRINLNIKIVSTSNVNKEIEGKLTVLYGKKILSKLDWEIPSGKNSTSLEFELKLDEVGEDSESKVKYKSQLEFNLDFNDRFNKKVNSITIDDSFKINPDISQYRALLVSEVNGERQLDDPMYFLQRSLQSLQFTARRIDNISQVSIDDYKLIISEVSEDINRFCPHRSVYRSIESIWLVPSINLYQNPKTYQNMCWCISYLMDDKIGLNNIPSICSGMNSIADISTYLKHTGASQVGGNYGDDNNIAWMLNKHNTQKESLIENSITNSKGTDITILNFLFPLTPIREIGIDHAKFPLIISSIMNSLNLKNLYSFSSIRIEDGSKEVGETDVSMLSVGNVPIGESILKKIEERSDSVIGISNVISFIKDESSMKESYSETRDSSRIIKICFWILELLLFLDIGFYFIVAIRNKNRGRL